MFKKFDEKESVSNCIQLKTSVIKGIKSQLVEQFPDKKTEAQRGHCLPQGHPATSNKACASNTKDHFPLTLCQA
uniref:MCTS family member 2 n=1 Tax=Homo sapiens TaxID=9606 RepID=A0ABB0MVC8_HUMAN